METPQDSPIHLPSEPSAALAERPAQAERLLGHLRRILGHDLSNQLVAVQGLLQLLQLEEGARLGTEGADYVRRASVATRQAQAMVLALKELARLGWEEAPREAVSLEDLAREVAAVVKKLHPGCTLEWGLDPETGRTPVHRRLLQQGLLRLLRSLLPAESSAPIRLGIHSRRTAAGVELTVATAAPVPANNSLDWILAQELLGACGGALCARSEPGRGNLFTLTVPLE